MTAFSCFAIGIAFVVAVVLLVVAGIFLGWLLPLRIRLGGSRGDRSEKRP
ncbi:MAG TPA: hypothetical protein VGK70_05030 [Thermoanaerobaculia bacterium]